MGGVKVTAAPVRAPRVAVRAPALRLVQPALRVGAVNDPAEHQAERMAARVAAGGTTPAAPPPAPRPILRRNAENQPNTDELTDPPVPADHADFDVPAEKDVGLTGLSTADLGELESGAPKEEPLAADRIPGAVVGRKGGAAPGDVAARVAHPGPGRPLPRAVAERMEPHFGTDFADVRLHDTAPDRDAAARIGARAFAHGPDIWLGPNERDSDIRLMAHELTHVVQQTRGADTIPRDITRDEDEGYVAGKFEGWARQVPGYTLLTVLVGRTLISGIKVDMTATNLLGGLFGLVPGGTLIFDRLNETHAVERAFEWVSGRLADLNITWARFEKLAEDGLSAVVSWSPIEELKKLFKPLVDDVLTFIADITQKVLEFIIRGALTLAGPYADQVWGFIERAKGAINLILEDPLGFAKNLIASIVGGFRKFGDNIIDHLKRGLLGWLFGAIAQAGITMPEKLDFKGIVSLLLQIIGVSYAAFRAMLVKKLGPRGERMVAFIEKSVEVVQLLVKEGFLGVWQKLIGMIDNLKQTVIGGINDMVITAVVKAGISWLAGLSNPVGAVVKIVLSIYDMVVTFLERLEQIKQVALSIFDSVEAIARGNITAAIDKVEETIGRTIPVVLSFLAALLGLNTIPQKIKAIFKRIQDPVAKAMAKMVDFIVKKAKALFSKLVKKVNGLRKLPGVAFKVGDSDHRMFAEKKGKGLEVYISTEKGTTAEVATATSAEADKSQEGESKADGQAVVAEVKDTDKKVEPLEKTNMESEAKPTEAPVAKLTTLMTAEAQQIEEKAKDTDKNPATTSKTTNKALLRAQEPRLTWLEGKVDSHLNLTKLAEAGPAGEQKPKMKVSDFYEMDHTMSKEVSKDVLDNMHFLDAVPSDKPQTDLLRYSEKRKERNLAAGRGANAAAVVPGTKPIGQFGAPPYTALGNEATALPAIAMYHRNHIRDKGQRLRSTTDILKSARTEGKDDPRAYVQKYLKQRVLTEVAEMRAVMARDPDADKVRAQVEAGLTAIIAKNDEIYGLANITPVEPRPLGKAKLPGGEGSEIAFNDPGGTDLTQEEGKGEAYTALARGGSLLERDHIIDKTYPLTAKTLPVLTADQAEAVRQAALAQNGATRLGSNQQARLDALTTDRLFAGTGMAGYTEGKGWAVALYRPLAKEVTRATGVSEDVAAFPARGFAVARPDLVEHVLKGDATALTRGVAALRQPLKKAFADRTDHHAGAVNSAYANQGQEVAKANPDREAEAQALMKGITDRVAASLQTARARTDALF